MAVTIVLVISLLAVLQPSTRATENLTQQKEIVDKHNALRRSVQPSASNMLKMEWDPKAAANAEYWAKQCTFSHSPREKRTVDGTPCGENLYMSTATVSLSEAIQAWYDEVKDFKYGHGSTTGAVIGHYTQLVWYMSWRIGCALVNCHPKKWRYYLVCQYCPAGNVGNKIKTPYELGKPCAKCPNACDNGLCTNPCKHDDDYSNCPNLKEKHDCNSSFMKEYCKASCLCTTEIK